MILCVSSDAWGNSPTRLRYPRPVGCAVPEITVLLLGGRTVATRDFLEVRFTATDPHNSGEVGVGPASMVITRRPLDPFGVRGLGKVADHVVRSVRGRRLSAA
jgi:hypothetical protein